MSKLVQIGNELYYNPNYESRMKKLINKIGDYAEEIITGIGLLAIYGIGGIGVGSCVIYFSLH